MRIVPLDAAGEFRPFGWDTVFAPVSGASDWEIAADGSLVARAPIETAVYLLLATDARAEPGDLDDDDLDRRGWWGDLVDDGSGHGPLGSRLWTLRRRPATAATAATARAMAEAALQPLIRQRLARAIRVDATLIEPGGRVDLAITVTGAAGDTSARYAILWDTRDADPAPLHR